MFDELEQDKVQQYTDQPAQPQETTEQPKPLEPVAQEVKQDSPKEQNLRILRERAERAERELASRDAKESAQRQQYEQPKPVQQQQYVDEDDLNLEDDSYVEAKYVKQLRKEVKETRKQLQEMNQMTSQSNAELRLKADYPDIMEVVTSDNLKDLQAVRPDIYETIMYNPDLYKRGKLAREMIKNYVSTENYAVADKRLEDNKAKPRASATVPTPQSETPLTRVGDYDRRTLTEERKDQLRRQVEEAKKYR